MTLTHKHLPVLQQARAMIETGAQRCICLALDEIMDAPDFEDLAGDVRLVIEAGLDSSVLFSSWLLDQLFGQEWDQEDLPSPYWDDWSSEGGVMRLGRLAWLDRLIANIVEN